MVALDWRIFLLSLVATKMSSLVHFSLPCCLFSLPSSTTSHPSSDEFIDLQYEENETKIIRFANYLRMVFQQPIPNADQGILEGAAKALGMSAPRYF